jgi:hypothetical protein
MSHITAHVRGNVNHAVNSLTRIGRSHNLISSFADLRNLQATVNHHGHKNSRLDAHHQPYHHGCYIQPRKV